MKYVVLALLGGLALLTIFGRKGADMGTYQPYRDDDDDGIQFDVWPSMVGRP